MGTEQPLDYRSLDASEQRVRADLSQLRTLAICHYVWGAVTVAFSCIFIAYIILGIAMIVRPDSFAGNQNRPPGFVNTPQFMGWAFLAIGSFAMLLGWAIGLLTLFSARCLQTRRRRTLSLVMAGVNCLSVPIGTLLGVFTFIVLFRPSVLALYRESSSSPLPPPPL